MILCYHSWLEVSVVECPNLLMVSTTNTKWSKYEPTATLNNLASVAVKFLYNYTFTHRYIQWSTVYLYIFTARSITYVYLHT